MNDPPLHDWHAALDAAIAARSIRVARRVAVVAETPSTQDAARAIAAGSGGAGLVVVAGRQTAGRGRLGRAWNQGAGLGLAMTIALDARPADAPRLALAAGVALARAITDLAPGAPVGLRWPNDAVETVRGRKIAGVLIEQAGPLALAGFGVNVHQRAQDWPDDLRGRAASLAELGSTAHRIDTATELLAALDDALRLPAPALAEQWRRYDTLLGRTATFTHGGQSTTGLVESIDPAHAITLRLPDGAVRILSAATAWLTPQGQSDSSASS